MKKKLSLIALFTMLVTSALLFSGCDEFLEWLFEEEGNGTNDSGVNIEGGVNIESDGYGLALMNFEPNSTTVPQYETFTIAYQLRNTSSGLFPINSQFGAALVNNDGSIAGIVGTRDYGWALEPRQRTGDLKMTCAVPNTVTPGQYQLRFIIKQTGSEWRLVTDSVDGAPTSINFQVLVNNNVIVAPLLQTQWSQGEPYNDSFPLKPDNSYAYNDIGKLYVDCSTTAMAQIFAYHKHPVRAAGTSTVLGPHGINMPLVNFADYPFDWANMRNTYTKGDPGTAKERKAVAELNFIVGMARSSGASSRTIYVENFGYDKSFQFHHRKDFTDTTWEAMIKEQLDQGLPVYYWGRRDGGSHAFVVDGYDKNSRFHINMGWGGTDDGWYTLNNINPPSSGHYNTDHLIFINIKPDKGIGSNIKSVLSDKTIGIPSSINVTVQ